MFVFPRPYWRCYYSNTDAVIYVVDSSDRDRMGISKSELVAMLEVDEISGHVIHVDHIASCMMSLMFSFPAGGGTEESHLSCLC